MSEITWRTDEPCPLCGTSLFLLDSLHAVCRLCGYHLILATDDATDWR
jgi:hypothetical protein